MPQFQFKALLEFRLTNHMMIDLRYNFPVHVGHAYRVCKGDAYSTRVDIENLIASNAPPAGRKPPLRRFRCRWRWALCLAVGLHIRSGPQPLATGRSAEPQCRLTLNEVKAVKLHETKQILLPALPHPWWFRKAGRGYNNICLSSFELDNSSSWDVCAAYYLYCEENHHPPLQGWTVKPSCGELNPPSSEFT